MDVSGLGEFGLIERLLRALPPGGERLAIGIGDDAAAWRSGAAFTLATTDTLVAGVHFLAGRVAWRDVGWKALAVNLSDIAAMGGRPTFALVTLLLPPETPVEQVDEIYAGLGDCARQYGVAIAGGDIVASPVLAITVALAGDADGAPDVLRRDAARPGDAIAVTGPLGGSAAGLYALQHDLDAARPEVRDAIARHARPQPRIAEGLAAVRAGVRCGIDVSDGLVQDLGHICEASSCGAELFDVLIDPALAALVASGAVDSGGAFTLAAGGGEDYELLLIAPDAAIARVREQHAGVRVIGRIVAEPRGVRVLRDGVETALPVPGWDHLRARPSP
jgi:thiamine-monophosphate kinase